MVMIDGHIVSKDQMETTEPTKKNLRCTAERNCWLLEEHIGSNDRRRRGLDVVELHYVDTDVRSRLMIIHRKSAKDRGTVLNFCPFCGGPTYFVWDHEGKLVEIGTDDYRRSVSTVPTTLMEIA